MLRNAVLPPQVGIDTTNTGPAAEQEPAGDDVVVDPMITAEFGLSQVVEAYQAATDKDNQIKVVINHEK